ncbi:MAG: histidine--tRNA ligase [Patescibacteria group bacterium]|nr:histidine--tRNA ligase [Patescibacteria group bacterium]
MPKKQKEKKKFVPRKNKEQKPKKKEAEGAVVEKGKRAHNILRGMHDILPREEKYWKTMFHVAENLAAYFQYGRIETPVMEEAGLFVRSLGKGTDVVEKEMYVFENQDGSKICLRPEATASVVRAYINAGMFNYPQPVKMWYWGPMFRHDRPQAGRYREFRQVGYEIIGAADPAMDAELILVAYNFYKDLGLPVEIRVNSIGLPEERERYKAELANYYRAKKSYICEDCRKRLLKNPLRLLDCKEDQCQPIKDEAPQIVDWLSETSKNYFMKVLEYLDALGIPYILQPTLVRGLDYYTHTVFEIYPVIEAEEGAAKETAQSALGGGGRYDLLMEEMGGRPTPAAGVALGIDRSVAVLKQYGEKHPINLLKPEYDIYFAQLGERAKGRALKMIEDLRQSGLRIGFNFYKNSLKTQLELANDLKVPCALILGQKEVQEGTIIIRDMESGIQEIVDQKKAENIVKKKLEKI